MTSRLSSGLIKMNHGTIGGQSRVATPVRSRHIRPSSTVPQPTVDEVVETPTSVAFGVVYQYTSFALSSLTVSSGIGEIDAAPLATVWDDAVETNWSVARAFVYAESALPAFDWVTADERDGGVTSIVMPAVPDGAVDELIVAWVIVSNSPSLATPDWGDGWEEYGIFVLNSSEHIYLVVKDYGPTETPATFSGFDTSNHLAVMMTVVPTLGDANTWLNEEIDYTYPTSTDVPFVWDPVEDDVEEDGEVTVSADPEGGVQYIIFVGGI